MKNLYATNPPAVNMTIVGFGQGGSRIADEFAAFKQSDGQKTYNVLALNSNDGDLEGLRNISKDKRISLELGGLGKNPEKATSILENNEKARVKLQEFIHTNVRKEDDLVLFFAGLGGGTGTSTIVKAISEFYDYHHKPLIKEELVKIREQVGTAEFKANQKQYIAKATKNAEEKFTKIGVIVTLPLRKEGPDVLRQVNKFSQEIWKLALDASKGIAFVNFADNQFFYDEFTKLSDNKKAELKVSNHRDYANKQIANIFHELNTAPSVGGTSVTLDKEDFKRAILEHTGSLVISKLSAPSHIAATSDAIVDLFKRSLKENSFHSPINLMSKNEDDGTLITKKVHHVGALAIIDQKKSYNNGEFITPLYDVVNDELPINGTIFPGYISDQKVTDATVYTFYKAEALPERLETGLVEEYEAYKQRNQKFAYEKSQIKSIEETDSPFDDMDLDLASLGLDDLLEDEPTEEVAATTEEDDLDFDKMLEDIQVSTEDFKK